MGSAVRILYARDGKKVDRTIYHEYIFNIMMNQKDEVLDFAYIHTRQTDNTPVSDGLFKLPVLIFK